MRSKLILLFENAFEINREAIAQAEKTLKDNGWTHSQFSELFNKASAKKQADAAPKAGGLRPAFGSSIIKPIEKSTSEKYKDLLQAEVGKLKKNDEEIIDDKGESMTDADISGHVEAGEFNKKEIAPVKDKPIRDESVIDALKLLATNLGPMGRDKAIVLAARFKIDPELIEGAGLGNLPPNYTDEDVWNILKISKKNGKPVPFIDSAWQPFYMEALEDLQELPHDIREHIVELLTSSDPRETTYPVSNKDSLIDDPVRNPAVRKVYEAKLVNGLFVESKDGMIVLEAGTKIAFTK